MRGSTIQHDAGALQCECEAASHPYLPVDERARQEMLPSCPRRKTCSKYYWHVSGLDVRWRHDEFLAVKRVGPLISRPLSYLIVRIGKICNNNAAASSVHCPGTETLANPHVKSPVKLLRKSTDICAVRVEEEALSDVAAETDRMFKLHADVVASRGLETPCTIVSAIMIVASLRRHLGTWCLEVVSYC